jgi:uncharacterized protein (TIGR02246 family)
VGRDEVRAFLEKRIRAWEQADFEAMMADYAPDIVHISPSGRREGVEVLRVANRRYLAEYTDVRVELTRLLVDGDQGALEWTWTETRRSVGLRRSAEDVIVFVLRDGKIAYWHEYFDTAGFQ